MHADRMDVLIYSIYRRLRIKMNLQFIEPAVIKTSGKSFNFGIKHPNLPLPEGQTLLYISIGLLVI